jgi:hypothetical protein
VGPSWHVVHAIEKGSSHLIPSHRNATHPISPGLQLGRASTSLVHYALLVQAARLLRTVGASAVGAGSPSGASIARVVREDADGNAISDSEGTAPYGSNLIRIPSYCIALPMDYCTY